MFSGIVAAVGVVEEVLPSEEDDMAVRLRVEDENLLARMVVGGSVACAGVCLTVVDKDRDFTVNVSKETLGVTNLKHWGAGTKVNLELPLRMGDPIDGHMVQGHVDGVGKVESIVQIAGSHTLMVSCNETLTRYISRKGSIALDGVSMTVNSSGSGLFVVNIIPHTWNHTTLQYIKADSEINIETDLVARYLESLVKDTRDGDV
ncbi:riboflavin synthase subunit alpha [Anaplasma centrale str. Israel]|uniref:Riboflavin synthase n=1 Tax=Anaplasma centrale (strain Israel) TaxID=574556 RepID=D1AT09_ANACI|nr:riboflavin synthase [Anaplasma centrale]ACZ49612.1 riboflavin synthase subunit alpha [Anaplasma centrale str. Israel]